ncbi:ABC transporter permease [Blastochloris tepida]|uniref:Putrescine/spermidine ABC transporter permease n=1 Tax=Blastochloris tepida TaxID=2233851 RepID=A0A348G2P6_9HYPH|nr:ABC transporter permease [Blastochloris tepida]BBF93829.1 putrescine/spermidine ABC transporter permease [Blastochloris tepida]
MATQRNAPPGRNTRPARNVRFGRLALIGVPALWLTLFVAVPFAIVMRISLSESVIAMPPYEPVFDLSAGFAALAEAVGQLDFDKYVFLTTDPLYLDSYLSSIRIAGLSTAIILAVGYPIAYAMARAPKRVQPLLVMLVVLPFWTSFLIRVYAWMGILARDGFLNQALTGLGLISEPLDILSTDTAVMIGIVYSYLPFMVLPLYASLEKMDDSLLEAAADLGCPPWQAFWRITVPLSLPGVVAGCLLVFIPAVGEFVIPDLLGGSDTLMIGKTLWSEFFSNRDWPVASAVAVVLLVALLVPIGIYQHMQARQLEADR